MLIGCAERNNPVHSEVDTALRLSSRTQTLGWAEDVWVHGDTAFVADGEQGVSIWDVSDPAGPVLIDTMRLERAYALMVRYAPQSDFVIVARKDGVSAHKLSDKTRLFRLWDKGIEDLDIIDLAPDTVIIAVVDWDEGFKINKAYFDSSYNSWVESDLAGTYLFQYGTQQGLYLDDTLAYVASNQVGLDVLGISYDPMGEFPIFRIGGIDTPGAAVDVAMSGDKTHLFVADTHGGLQIIDVTEPSAPEITGCIIPDRVDNAYQVAAIGDTVCFLDKYNGVYVIDARNPSAPELIARYDTPSPNSVFVNGDHRIFIADKEWGLVILDWRD